MYSLILDQAIGDAKPGSTFHTEDETVAEALISSGVAHEATADELNGEGEDEAEMEGADTPAVVENAVNDLVTKATKSVTKAAEKAVKSLATKSVKTPVISGAFVAEPKKDIRNDFKSFGHFARSIAMAEHDYGTRKKMTPWQVKGQQNEGTAADGGYAVPQEWSAQMFQKDFGQPFILDMCQQYPMPTNVLNIPAFDVTETDVTGIVPQTTTEANSITDTKFVAVNRQLQLDRLSILVNVTEELLQDSPYALDTFIRNHAPVKIGLTANKQILSTGGSHQANLINGASTVAVTRKTANKVQYADLANMYTRLWPASKGTAAWFVSPQVYAQILLMTFPDSSGTFPATVITGGFGNISGRPQLQVLGLPVYQILNLPGVGSKGDVCLFDMNSVACGKRDLDAGVSPHLYFDKYISSFRFVLRFSTTSLWNGVYTPSDTVTLSPFVVLDIASS